MRKDEGWVGDCGVPGLADKLEPSQGFCGQPDQDLPCHLGQELLGGDNCLPLTLLLLLRPATIPLLLLLLHPAPLCPPCSLSLVNSVSKYSIDGAKLHAARRLKLQLGVLM